MKCVVCSNQVVENDGCEFIELLDPTAFIRDHARIRVRISYMCSPKCFRVFLQHRGHTGFKENSIIKILED